MTISISELKRLYESGVNVTEVLKKSLKTEVNTPDIIEAAYDLQSGSYIRHYQKNRAFASEYSSTLARLLKPWATAKDSVLDVGTGEMTTYGPTMNELSYGSGFACDISLSRLLSGRRWLKDHFPKVLRKTSLFVADLASLPFQDSSIDIIWSNHALEPNHGREAVLISELLRVAKKAVLLFEPHFESAGVVAQERMAQLGYVRNLETTISNCGGELVELIKLPIVANTLNHTHCFIVIPPKSLEKSLNNITRPVLVCPKQKEPLDLKTDGCILSSSGLMAYPLVNGIPLLRSHLAFPLTHPELVSVTPIA